jgi:hypothetical protein
VLVPEGRPFHTLPHDELVARLRALTNLRVVEDASSATGYRVEPGAFPGWERVPEWWGCNLRDADHPRPLFGALTTYLDRRFVSPSVRQRAAASSTA